MVARGKKIAVAIHDKIDWHRHVPMSDEAEDHLFENLRNSADDIVETDIHKASRYTVSGRRRSKLTIRQVQFIQDYADGLTQKQMAAKYEVHETNINKVISSAKWHLECNTLMELIAVSIAAGYVIPKPPPVIAAPVKSGKWWLDAKKFPDLKNRGLTPKERELICCVADGLQDKEIGKRLGISEDTINTYLHRLYERMNVKNRTHLAVTAIRMGFIS